VIDASLRVRPARVGLGLIIAGLAFATTVPLASAADQTAYVATFPMEQTIQRTCPPGAPPNAFCFTGSDHSGLGTSTPPGGKATEDFAGFVDFTKPIADACAPNPGSTQRTPGFPDHNVVALGTQAGKIFMTTSGVDCMSTGTDDGTWRIFGGTGIFEDATGTGTVHTQATGGTGAPDKPITSFSTYTGTVTLHN
jgi:hypothetical protein